MRSFTIRLVVFIIPIFVLAAGIELLLRKIPNNYLYKRNYLENNTSKINTLVLGSSHSFYGLDPQYFKSPGFNAANVSQTLEYDDAIYEKYQHQLNHLKVIVLPIDYFTLYTTLHSGQEPWRVKNYEIYCKIHLSKSFADRFEVLNGNLLGFLSRIGKYYIKKKSPLTSSTLGWGTEYDSRKGHNLDSSGVIAAKRHTIASDKYFEFNVKTLNRLVILAKKKIRLK